MDVAGFLLLLELLENEKSKPVLSTEDQVIPLDPGLVKMTPKPIKKVDDTQVRPRGRFGL